jgi:hypothetical protein
MDTLLQLKVNLYENHIFRPYLISISVIGINKDTFFYDNPHDIQKAPKLKLTPKKII